ncbi:MAG TPA: dTDP-4-dehydrorhamnose reductase [Vicinamibacterales bacterium]|nr:dTDP-4-dehydrorhamnose reductase [Vicinamibacterales bacterium]
MRVAVTGAGGQLGAVLVHEFRSAHDVVGFSHRELNIGDDGAVAAAMDAVQPELILNAAAYTDVDGSEDHPVDALNANAFGVRALARAALRHGATLVHYSTDFVFDGTTTQPYTERDQPNPRSVYSHSKLLGEWFALDAPKAYVLRVESLFGGVAGGPLPRGSVASILNTLRAGGAPKVFVDRTVSPTYAIDAGVATRKLVEMRAPFGIYHCVNSGHCTWFEFARELAQRAAIAASFTPMRMSEVTLRAIRPQYCALSNEKLRALGIEMPSWQDALSRFLQSGGDQVAH